VMARAREDLLKGEFRWVAEVMKHAVYAHPSNLEARELAAQAMEQMGFQAESATWRNSYLLAAREYRQGPAKAPTAGPANMGLLSGLTIEMIFDTLAVRLNAPKAAGQNFDMAWHFTDLNEHWLLSLSNGALSALRADHLRVPLTSDVQLSLDRRTLEDLLAQRVPATQAIEEGRLKLTGNVALLAQFFAMLDRFSGTFPVVDAAALPG
jgi:alkyl sulfatase BDS1-like metallo-beta-lactamase superfamily hydrolase